MRKFHGCTLSECAHTQRQSERDAYVQAQLNDAKNTGRLAFGLGNYAVAIHPDKGKNFQQRLRWPSCARLPCWGQAARTPDTHNALASGQKNAAFIANNIPTYHHPWPPLPGKCDGERVSEPTPTPPGLEADLNAGPEAALAQATDSASGMCAGQYILLTLLVS